MTDLSEDALVHGALSEDREAFGTLYQRFYPRLVRLVARKTGDRLLAEDVAQDTLLRAFDRLDTFDRSRPLWPWLKVIATNLAVDAGRKRSREVACEPDDQTLPAKEMPSCEDGMLLAQVLAKLPDRQRVAVSLRYLQDWESSEAASFLGLSIPAFEQLLFRARKKLRLEYSRIAQGAFGVLGIPWRRLRREALRLLGHVPGARRTLDSVSQMGITWVQAAAGGIALLAVLPAVPAVVPPTRGSDRVIAVAAADEGARTGSRGPHRPADRGAARGPAAPAPSLGAAPVALADGSGSRAGNPLEEVTDPNGRVKEPEDARIVSLAYAGGGKRAFATGVSHCRLGACSPVLFETRDGGGSWSRLPAHGFSGHTLVVPPGSDGTVLFAMSPAGLQVSEDGGESFTMAALTGAAPATGSVAVSPAFDRGDPTMLIGAQTLLRYDDTKATISPEPSTTLSGPFEPAFAPAYPLDTRYLLGGLRADPQEGLESTVFECSASMCTYKTLRDGKGVPKLRLRPDYARSDVAFAFTENHLYRSSDAWSFSLLPTPWDEASILRDVALLRGGDVMLAAVHAIAEGGDEGLYRSEDGGLTWTPVAHRLFARGAAAVAASGEHVVVALAERGLACSGDAGASWSRRC